MDSITTCFLKLGAIVNAFIPPALFYPAVFFVGIMAFMKLFRSVE